MTASPVQLPADDQTPTPDQTRPDPTAITGPREATVRAIAIGCAIGVVLAAGNVYTGLKTSFIDGGSITAALLSFTFFTTFRGLSKRPYSALENNITQTTASSAAIMSFVLGVCGPIPALTLMGYQYSPWALCLWGICLGFLGILIAALLRRKLIINENLPFPTGAATAEVIETMYAARQTALDRARLLLLAALLAAGATWFRDGQPSIIPGATMLPGAIAGISAASLTLGINWSPLMASTGMFMGMRNAASLLIGAVITWGVIAPRLVTSGIVQGAGYSAFVSWMVWPGLGLMTSSTLLPLAMGWRTIGRSLRDLPQMMTRSPFSGGPSSTSWLPHRKLILLASAAVVVAVSSMVFHVHPVATIAALLLSVVLASVCGRAAGETDMAPIGSAGTLMQLLFAGFGPVVSIFSGAIAAGDASQASQTLWALKAGHRLKASPRSQITAQMIGAVLGAVVVVPVYLVIVKTYGIGTEAMPAASALSWKATADAVRGGLAAMPPYGPVAGAIGIALGIILCLAARTRVGRFLPSPMVLGIAALTPASLSVAAFVGALALLIVRKARPGISESSVAAVAAGGIAGESIMGVIIAALIASGIL